MDREDALVAEYRNIVAAKGDFKFTCSAIVLHPQFDRTRFHLIYATRHPKGVKVFKETEKAAMQQMQQVRGDVQQRKHEDDAQRALLPDMWRDSSYFDSLRERYTQSATNAILALLRRKQACPYDDAWELALSFPLTWESDLRGWIDGWVQHNQLELGGMLPRQRVLQYGKGNVLLWKALSN